MSFPTSGVSKASHGAVGAQSYFGKPLELANLALEFLLKVSPSLGEVV